MNPKEQLASIFKSALRAADPEELLRERLGKIPPARKLIVVGAGKAAGKMAATLEEYLLDRISSGCIAVKPGYAQPLQKIESIEAGHPNPDENSIRAGQRIIDLLRDLSAEDVVVALISGGASSLIAVPKQGSLEDFIVENESWLASGLPIQEINRRRRKRLLLADGGLARLAAPARVISFILSDVMGNDPASIGSGPTVLDSGESRVLNILIGDNTLAVGGAARAAMKLGYSVQVLPEPMLGEAKEFGAAFGKKLELTLPNTALIVGGECTVSLSRPHGLGGRCQEIALSASRELASKEGFFCLFAGTDGNDGPTDAAGAFADGATFERAKKLGLDPEDFLKRHDSYPFFRKLGDLFITGPTLTNVADLAIGIRLGL